MRTITTDTIRRGTAAARGIGAGRRLVAARATRLLGYAVAAVAVAGLAWLVITGLIARSRLEAIRAELPQLHRAISAGNLVEARALADHVATEAQRAHALTTGPAWWLAAHVPFVGSPVRTARVIACQVDRVGGSALPLAVRVTDDLSRSFGTPSSIDLSKLADAAPGLRAAAATTRSAIGAIQASAPSWLPPVSSARSSLLAKLSQLSDDLAGGNRAMDLALPMLGAATPQRYFIGFMNEAEARGLGGIPGAFAIATADHGRIRFDHFGSDTELAGVRADVHLDAEYERMYGQDDPAGTFANSDVGPDFRDAARIWAGMWQARTGQHIDAAIAIDPTALSDLLKVSGPARLPNGGEVSARNVVALTQQAQYAKFADPRRRKAYVVSIARAVGDRLAHAHWNLATVKAASRAATARRVMLWSASPRVESALAGSVYGGALRAGPGAFSGFTVVNAAGNKLDYYLARSMSYRRSGCNANSIAVATLHLTNKAPRSGLPSYVTLRADHPPPTARPGDNHVIVTYFATPGARLLKVVVNAQTRTIATSSENGLFALTIDLELRAGVANTITVTTSEPAVHGPVTFLRQPLVRPLAMRVSGSACGGSTVSSRGTSGP